MKSINVGPRIWNATGQRTGVVVTTSQIKRHENNHKKEGGMNIKTTPATECECVPSPNVCFEWISPRRNTHTHKSCEKSTGAQWSGPLLHAQQQKREREGRKEINSGSCCACVDGHWVLHHQSSSLAWSLIPDPYRHWPHRITRISSIHLVLSLSLRHN